ncbi:endonuclease/exonuclease/phosphatase family protein [Vitreoscilla massiliensis]|uniref:Endonuclease/exonuclease/phosphatase family protein n=1 Tax=Vitreoscilla massiliensis TaxID=1689272 RepID=A0ABY4E1F7_9NEIS|nr:endonuclease/exonuclease/phosphatase family protein [Vitreoscilla massiliensis]UOO88158.1 endonuclease/exonuclease/phosphatase family protein [Vitreoscilla massiliensis]
MNSRRLLSFMRKCWLFLAYASLAALLLGELGRHYWLLELFSHFVPVYAVLLVFGALSSRQHVQRLLFGLTAAALAVWMFTPTAANKPSSPAAQRFISYNLYINNPQTEADFNWLLQQQADVVFLTEATPLMGITQHLQAAYPYGCERLDDSPFGLILLSKQPLSSCEVLQYGSLYRFPAIRAQLGNGRVVYAMHPPPPISAFLAKERDRVLQDIAAQVAQESGEVLVMGDMNNSAFAPSFRQFIQDSGLNLQAPRAMPTWRPGLIGIDHILRRSKHTATVTYGPWLGSDHRPVIARW